MRSLSFTCFLMFLLHSSQTLVSAQQATLSAEANAVFDWARTQGGTVHMTAVNDPGNGRTSAALRDFQPGDVVASIPESLMFAIEGKDLHKDAWAVLEQMRDPSNKLRLYWESFPPKGSVYGIATIPKSYWRLLQSPIVEAALKDYHDWLEETWAAMKELVKKHLGQEVEYEDILHARALIDTRSFNLDEGFGLVPVVDLINHHYHCQNQINLLPCDSEKPDGEKCWILAAGEHLNAGQEVCLRYRYLTQDMTLMLYGFLQGGSAMTELSALDRHDFEVGRPLDFLPYYWDRPADFTGTREKIAQEIQRLQRRLEEVKSFNQQLKRDGVEADPRDKGAMLLWRFLTWRWQREAALEAELTRLEELLDAPQAAQQGTPAAQQLDTSGGTTDAGKAEDALTAAAA